MKEVCLEKEEFEAFLRLVRQALLFLEIKGEESNEKNNKEK